MKRKNRHRKTPEFANADFAEALFGENKQHRGGNRQAHRKNQQFCRQVQRALNLALADLDIDGLGCGLGCGLSCDLFVDEVSPGPDCGHLLVHIVVPDGSSIADAMDSLRRNASRLRSEVATAIARKRAPELSFVPVTPAGGAHE